MKSAIFRFQANNALQEENNYFFKEKKKKEKRYHQLQRYKGKKKK
jgi:hypothetical protein